MQIYDGDKFDQAAIHQTIGELTVRAAAEKFQVELKDSGIAYVPYAAEEAAVASGAQEHGARHVRGFWSQQKKNIKNHERWVKKWDANDPAFRIDAGSRGCSRELHHEGAYEPWTPEFALDTPERHGKQRKKFADWEKTG